MFDSEDVQDSSNWIAETYGSREVLANQLDKGIEMLFYIEEDTFERKEIQDIVAALRGIIVLLRQ